MMIGETASKLCPVCGGDLEAGLANIPFIFGDAVIVIKQVPAEICGDCHEPFLAGYITDEVMSLLNRLKVLPSEVSVVNYPEALVV